MTQTTLSKPVVEEKTCAECPYFQSYNEPEHLTDGSGDRFPNPRFGCGWCGLFDQLAKQHHEMTQTCVFNGADIKEDESVTSYELEDNLDAFPEVKFEPSELQAFPLEEIIDEADLPHSEYQVGSVVKVIDADEPHTEWAVFEVAEVRENTKLYDDTESYLNGAPFHYLLASLTDGRFFWVGENEICHFHQSHLICTDEDLFF
ncbi:MAG: hypothetical protein AAF652_17150 [Cyanobacteria bacterium P01_C01_bin.72]